MPWLLPSRMPCTSVFSRFCLSASIFLSAGGTASAAAEVLTATDTRIEIVFRFEPPAAANSGDYDTIDIPGLVKAEIPGEPRLPVRPVRILLPFNREPAGIEVAAAAKVRLAGNYRVEPAREPVPLGASGSTEKAEVYQRPGPYPGRTHDPFERQHKRAFQFLQTLLYPAEYHPLSGEVYWFPEIRVRIELKPAAPPWRPRAISAEDRPQIQSMVDNPLTVETYK
jgi:hypothetical protein